MAFSTDYYARAAYKKVFGKSNIGADAEIFNEAYPSGVSTAAREVYIDDIPTTAQATPAIIDCTGANALGLALVPAANGLAYQAVVPSLSHPLVTGNYINPFTNSLYVPFNYDTDNFPYDTQQASFVGDIIPQKYDPTPGNSSYRARVFDDGTEVPPLVEENWYFEEKSGIVVSELNLNLGTTGTIECYKYVGALLSDVGFGVEGIRATNTTTDPNPYLTGQIDLEQGSNVTLVQTGNTIRIDASGSGGGTITGAANVGVGEDVYVDATQPTLEFRRVRSWDTNQLTVTQIGTSLEWQLIPDAILEQSTFLNLSDTPPGPYPGGYTGFEGQFVRVKTGAPAGLEFYDLANDIPPDQFIWSTIITQNGSITPSTVDEQLNIFGQRGITTEAAGVTPGARTVFVQLPDGAILGDNRQVLKWQNTTWVGSLFDLIETGDFEGGTYEDGKFAKSTATGWVWDDPPTGGEIIPPGTQHGQMLWWDTTQVPDQWVTLVAPPAVNRIIKAVDNGAGPEPAWGIDETGTGAIPLGQERALLRYKADDPTEVEDIPVLVRINEIFGIQHFDFTQQAFDIVNFFPQAYSFQSSVFGGLAEPHRLNITGSATDSNYNNEDVHVISSAQSSIQIGPANVSGNNRLWIGRYGKAWPPFSPTGEDHVLACPAGSLTTTTGLQMYWKPLSQFGNGGGGIQPTPGSGHIQRIPEFAQDDGLLIGNSPISLNDPISIPRTATMAGNWTAEGLIRLQNPGQPYAGWNPPPTAVDSYTVGMPGYEPETGYWSTWQVTPAGAGASVGRWVRAAKNFGQSGSNSVNGGIGGIGQFASGDKINEYFGILEATTGQAQNNYLIQVDAEADTVGFSNVSQTDPKVFFEAGKSTGWDGRRIRLTAGNGGDPGIIETDAGALSLRSGDASNLLLESGNNRFITFNGGHSDPNNAISWFASDGSYNLLSTFTSFRVSAGTDIKLSAGVLNPSDIVSISNIYRGVANEPERGFQAFDDITGSSAYLSGFAFTDNGDGTWSLGSGKVIIRNDNLVDAPLEVHLVPGVTNQPIGTEEEHDVYVDYNAGSPQVVVDTGGAALSNSIANYDQIPLGVVYRNNDIVVHPVPFTFGRDDFYQTYFWRLADTQPVLGSGGSYFDIESDDTITVSADTIWMLHDRFVLPAFDTGGTDTFFQAWDDFTGGWDVTAGETLWNDTLYNNAGTLSGMNNNRYGVNWYYRDTEGEVVEIVDTYNTSDLAVAEVAEPPTNLPDRFRFLSMLLAKVVFQFRNQGSTIISITRGQSGGGGGGGGSGATSLDALNDTPNSKAGSAGLFLKVSSGENTTEYGHPFSAKNQLWYSDVLGDPKVIQTSDSFSGVLGHNPGASPSYIPVTSPGFIGSSHATGQAVTLLSESISRTVLGLPSGWGTNGQILTTNGSNAATWQDAPGGGGGIGGSGTAGRVPRWTASDTIGNSSISDNGTSTTLNGTMDVNLQKIRDNIVVQIEAGTRQNSFSTSITSFDVKCRAAAFEVPFTPTVTPSSYTQGIQITANLVGTSGVTFSPVGYITVNIAGTARGVPYMALP